MSDHCPCCGSPVRVHTGSEGTSSYEPVVAADALDKALEMLERVIDEGVERWHTTVNDEPQLHSWLGLTWDEYKAWAEGRLAALPPRVEPVCGRASDVKCEVPLCPYPHCDAFLPGYAGPRQDCEDGA